MGTDEDEDEDADEDDDDDDGDEDEDAPAVLRACACVFVYNSGGRSVMHTFESLERNAAPKRDALKNPKKSPWPDSSGAEAGCSQQSPKIPVAGLLRGRSMPWDSKDVFGLLFDIA